MEIEFEQRESLEKKAMRLMASIVTDQSMWSCRDHEAEQTKKETKKIMRGREIKTQKKNPLLSS